MTDFITLTMANAEDGRFSGLQVHFPANAIAYRKAALGHEVGSGANSVVFFGGVIFNVRETPKQIAALMGVNDADVIDRARFLLDRLNDLDIDQDVDDLRRDYTGHVEPAIAQLRTALAGGGAAS